MAINVTPIPRLTVLATPAFTLGTTNTAGAAVTAVASNSTLLAFDGTLPDAITYGQSGAAGSATVASRRDHAHAMAASENDLVLIGTVVADASSTITVTGLDSTYDTYLIAASDIKISADANGVNMRFGDDGGIDSGGTDYAFITQNMVATSASYSSTVSTGADAINLATRGVGNATIEGLGANIWLCQPGDSTQEHKCYGLVTYADSDGNLSGGSFIGRTNAALTLTQVQLLPTGGNFTSGRLTVWGYQHA
jgi:hypothetical protein